MLPIYELDVNVEELEAKVAPTKDLPGSVLLD